MTDYRLTRLAEIAAVCGDDVAREEAAKIQHDCYRNGGVDCLRCEMDEAASEAADQDVSP